MELKYRLQVSQKDARENLYKSKLLRKEIFDKEINPIYYKKDDLILLRNPISDKKQSVYLGPYLVIEDLCPNVKILINGKEKLVHKNRTKPFKR